jgi:hypothetical protein
LVKPEVALRQMVAEAAASTSGAAAGGETTAGAAGDGPAAAPATGSEGPGIAAQVTTLRRFHGTVQLEPARVGRDASRVAEEVIAHLAGQVGAEVTVTLEIEAKLPAGASDQIVRTITENSRTLKFSSHGFEKD